MPGPTLLRDLAREIRDDPVLGLAAEIAFFTMLGLCPGLLVAAGLLGGEMIDGLLEDRRRTVADP